MINLLEQHDTIQEALAVHEALRRLGFPSDNIFVQPSGGANMEVLRVVLVVGEKRFSIDVGEQGMSDDEFTILWPNAVVAWNRGEETVRSTIYRKSRIRQRAVELVTAILDKGIDLPAAKFVKHPAELVN